MLDSGAGILYIRVANLQNDDSTTQQLYMVSSMQAPPFSETIDVTTFTCRVKNAAGSMVEEVLV